MRCRREQQGQATVELVALLPVLVLVGLLCWQVVVAGQAVWLSGAAARGAARAASLGHDPRAAARRTLPPGLRGRVRVQTTADGGVRVVVGIPAVIGGLRLGGVTARARFVAQGS